MLSQCVQSFSSHCWGAFVGCLMPLCGEVGLKPCASCVLTRTVWVFTNHVEEKKKKQTIKCTKCALWVTDLPHHHHPQHLAWLPKVTGHSSCFTWALWDQHTKKKICLISHISSRGTGSTFDISQHQRQISPCKTFSISETTVCKSMCTVKKKPIFYLYTVFCASLFLLLCWTSPLDSWNFLDL